MSKKFLCIVTLIACCLGQVYAVNDVNLIGFIRDISSISRHATSFVDCLSQTSHLKLFKTLKSDKNSSNQIHRELIQSGIPLKNHVILNQRIKQGLELTGITIYTDSLWGNKGARNAWKEYSLIPNKSVIKYAFVVTEATQVSFDKVKIFNNHFDALIVPDPWLEQVYYQSGVKIPILTLPLVLDLKSLYKKPKIMSKKNPFIFGFSGQDHDRKNVALLLTAFLEEFGDDENVQLMLHSRYQNRLNPIKEMIKGKEPTNITIIHKAFKREEYEDFLSSLSCYVILSKGEGFSITPREALAAGIPCVLSNNTAHKVICDTGYVIGVRSDIVEPVYSYKNGSLKGVMFNCTVQDTRRALREVYERHEHYVNLAQKGREWTTQYLAENLKSKYINLIQPARVILGNENKITEEYLMVNSRALFDKYRILCRDSKTDFVE